MYRGIFKIALWGFVIAKKREIQALHHCIMSKLQTLRNNLPSHIIHSLVMDCTPNYAIKCKRLCNFIRAIKTHLWNRSTCKLFCFHREILLKRKLVKRKFCEAKSASQRFTQSFLLFLNAQLKQKKVPQTIISLCFVILSPFNSLFRLAYISLIYNVK